MATDGRAAAHIDNVKALPKRETIKVPLTAALVKSLNFHQWPVSPLRWDGPRLVTEPTPPHVKDWIVRDSVTRGLGVRVTSGSKSYFVQRKRKGSTSDRYVLTQQQNLQDARIQAAAWYAVMAEGKNPTQTIRDRAQAEADIRAAKSFTFGLAFTAYVEDGESRVTNLTLRPASLKDRRAVVKWMEASDLWSVPLADVDTVTVKNTFEPLFASAERARRERRLRDDEGPRKRGGLASDVAAVHKVLTYCKACWTWTAGQKVAVNPFAAWAKGTKLPKVGRRQSVLPMETEAGAVWLRELVALRDAEDPAMSVRASYVLLAVLWGGRRSELAEIRWGDVNFAENCVLFAAETTKANRDHYVPLTPWAADLLKERREKNAAVGWPTKWGDRVFPYPTTKTGKIEDYRPVTEFLEGKSGLRISLHDLRRTLATSVFGSAGDLGTVSIALGHSSRQDVTAGYVQRQAALAALRNLYDAREKLLRQLIGLDAAPQSSVLSDFQKSMIQTVQTLLRQAGLHELAPHDLAALLAEQ